MLKSFCIKTNNIKILDYLVNEIENLEISNVYASRNSFKIYKNILIHYTGEQEEEFLHFLSSLITDLIVHFYEYVLVNRNLNTNYFYFDQIEKKQISTIVMTALKEKEYEEKYKVIYDNVYAFVLNYNTVILDGFVNFRLKDYLELLDCATNFGVNKFLIEQEYDEFIKLLRSYIETKKSTVNTIHLIYSNQTCILLDAEKNVISLNKTVLDAKYLSDISFSSNDYALNTLLNILPKKLHIHIVDEEDDFIKTLKLIFGNRVCICDSCNMCKTYKLTKDLVHAEKD